MTEAEWATGNDPRPLLSHFYHGSERKLRLIAVACARRHGGRLTDERSRRAVDVAERFADFEATDQEMNEAFDTAFQALTDAEEQSRAAEPDGREDWRIGPSRDTPATAAAALTAFAAASPQYAGDYAFHLSRVFWESCQLCLMLEGGQPTPEGHEVAEQARQAGLFREVFFNPFRPSPFTKYIEVNCERCSGKGWERVPGCYMATECPSCYGRGCRGRLHPWLAVSDGTAHRVAEGICQERAFGRLPILADALLDAGCDAEELLAHLRSPGPHVKGCWAVDMILGRD